MLIQYNITEYEVDYLYALKGIGSYPLRYPPADLIYHADNYLPITRLLINAGILKLTHAISPRMALMVGPADIGKALIDSLDKDKAVKEFKIDSYDGATHWYSINYKPVFHE